MIFIKAQLWAEQLRYFNKLTQVSSVGNAQLLNFATTVLFTELLIGQIPYNRNWAAQQGCFPAKQRIETTA
ncbi:MAG: hypothetical protein WAZ19_12930 [Anaerolineae bacterium]